MIIIAVVLGIILITYLLVVGKIKAVHYTGLFTAIILTSLALHGFDRLKEFDLKNFKIIFTKMQDIQKDVYAKAETVKKLGEKVAELTAYNVITAGRLVIPSEHQVKMLKARDDIKQILTEIGSSRDKIEDLSSEIEEKVLFDLKSRVSEEVEKITHKILKEGEQINRSEICSKTRELLKDYNRASLVRYLEEQNVYREKLIPLLDGVDKFIKDKKL